LNTDEQGFRRIARIHRNIALLSHRRHHSAGYHRLNLLVPLSLLLESARFIRRTAPCDEN